MSLPPEPAVTESGEIENDTSFFGHPKGLFYLSFTEAWERFSYYGMTALLVLYMVNQLLLPGHVENIVGFAALRSMLESVVGPLSPVALASQLFGLYAGFVYFTPVLGGLIADRWMGQRKAVVIGALCMSGGHLAMTFDQSFLLALLLLVIGSGFLKGNISAQVGALYPVDEEARRTRGFAIFSMSINFGAVCGPLLCGALAQMYGWHYGFGVSAIFMLAGLATYLYGYRHLPARVARRTGASTRLTGGEWRTIALLVAVMGITLFQSVGYLQIFNIFPVWLQQSADLTIGTTQIPVPWYQSIEAVFGIVGVPLLFWVWRARARRDGELSDLSKIGMGAWITVCNNLVLVLAIQQANGAPIHPILPAIYCAGMGVSFLCYWPTLLALVSRAAPAAANATMMGVVFLTLFVANNIVGWLGRYYEQLPHATFWGLHGGIAAVGGVLVLLFGGQLTRLLTVAAPQPLRPSAMTREIEV